MKFTFDLLLILALVAAALGSDCYKNVRKLILQYEQQIAFGGNLTLTKQEEVANRHLMKAKWQELKAGFEHPETFAPGKNFMVVKPAIEQSAVFKQIKRLPKGAVLHAHDTAIVSMDYIYSNITFRDNLYMCDVNGILSLKFFRKPSNECNWEVLSTVRADPKRGNDVNNRIIQQLSMVVENPDEVYTDVDKAWTKFSNIFRFLGPMLQYKPVYEDYFYRGLEELWQDNVMYIELRAVLRDLYDLDGRTYPAMEIVGMYEDITRRFMATHPDFVGAKIIYAPLRLTSRDTVREYLKTMKQLKTAYPNFIAGFDLVGQEDKGKTLQYFSEIMMEADPEIDFFFHAGETNWNGESTDENLIDAILLNTRRIGHGYALANHPLLLELIKRLNIAIEVSPISNQVLTLVKDLRNHAARRLFAESYPVVISNDDPGLWGARALSYDFYEAFMALMSKHSDLRALKQLALNSINYSSMSATEKEHAINVWRTKWDEFIAQYNAEEPSNSV